MPSKILSGALQGIDGFPVEVEVDIGPGVPRFFIVGLPDTSVSESRERVKAALRNSGFSLPGRKIVVNLAPAAIRKEGAAFDLPIALGILMEEGKIPRESSRNTLIVGELSLEGTIRPVPGVLGIALRARDENLKAIVVPRGNEMEAGLVEGLEVFPAATLLEAIRAMNHETPPYQTQRPLSFSPQYEVDFSDIKGLESAKRAVEIAAAGGHNMLMIGPPGAGKTMLAQRLPTILPPLEMKEAIEVTKIYSAAGLLPSHRPLILERPFRFPHHTISPAGMAGGGTGMFPRPGEISLSHQGVLFMDEFPLFRRDVLNLLRGPMEDGFVMLSRAAGSVTYPASFQLVAAMNPCPCGFLGDPEKECQCSSGQIQKYRGKISGPLRDRLDVTIEVPRIDLRELKRENGETSESIRKRVEEAQQIQRTRYQGLPFQSNHRLPSRLLKKYCTLPEEAENLLNQAAKRYFLSPRGIVRILRVSRTIADMEKREKITTSDVAEAIQYRGEGLMWVLE